MADPLYDNPRSPAPPDPRDLSDQYNTKLSDKDEAAYQKWATENNRTGDSYDYDMRGAWKEGVKQGDNGHFPDTYKKPNHPTFSDESKYSDKDNKGGKWSKKNGRDVFTPGTGKYWNRNELQGYLTRSDPDVDLAPEE